MRNVILINTANLSIIGNRTDRGVVGRDVKVGMGDVRVSYPQYRALQTAQTWVTTPQHPSVGRHQAPPRVHSLLRLLSGRAWLTVLSAFICTERGEESGRSKPSLPGARKLFAAAYGATGGIAGTASA